MELQECFNLMCDIRKAHKDVTTPVGACKSLQDHMDKDAIQSGQERNGIVSIGECLPDGRYALYATFPNRIVPKEWQGCTVIDTTKA